MSKTTDTGVYIKSTTRVNRKSVEAMAKAWNRSCDLDVLLDKIEADAKAVLARPEPPKATAGDADLERIDATRRDAKNIIARLIDLRRQLAAGNGVGVAFHAVHIGAACERLAIRPFEKYVAHAMRATKGLSSARDKKAKKDASRRQDITDAVTKRMTAHRKESLHSARKYVASQLGVSFDAVRRATAEMRPREKTKK